MKEVIITIVKSKMIGQWDYTLMINKKKVSSGHKAGNCTAGAAAKAMELAINYGGNYYIFAPNDVLAHIPEHLRVGKTD